MQKQLQKNKMSTNDSSFKSQKCSSVSSMDKMIHGEVFISRGLTTPHKMLSEKNLK